MRKNNGRLMGVEINGKRWAGLGGTHGGLSATWEARPLGIISLWTRNGPASTKTEVPETFMSHVKDGNGERKDSEAATWLSRSEGSAGPGRHRLLSLSVLSVCHSSLWSKVTYC